MQTVFINLVRLNHKTIQTPGFAELFPDSELAITFSNGFTAEFEFKVRLEGRI